MATITNIGNINSPFLTLTNTKGATGASGSVLTQGVSTAAWTSLLDTGNEGMASSNVHYSVKKHQIFEAPEDTLTLSATWYRMRKEGTYGVTAKLLDGSLFNKITDADRELAFNIRDYYSKKIMMKKLKSERMSKYREDLNTYIHGDGKTIREDFIGLVYNLPEFYEYDCVIDKIKESSIITLDSLPKTNEYKPLERIVRKTKAGKVTQYWMRNVESNTVGLIIVSFNNPLDYMWSHMFDASPTIKIVGKQNRSKTDGFEYVLFDKWHIEG